MSVIWLCNIHVHEWLLSQDHKTTTNIIVVHIHIRWCSCCFNSNTMGVTSGAGTGYLSYTHCFYWCSCCSIFRFLCIVLWIIVCLSVRFHLTIVLSALRRFTTCDWPFRHLQTFFMCAIWWCTWIYLINTEWWS